MERMVIMGLFKSKEERLLDSIIASINMNMSNNYKDAAQMDLQELEEVLRGMQEDGTLKGKTLEAYESQLGIYKERLKGFTHKDQKPYWT